MPVFVDLEVENASPSGMRSVYVSGPGIATPLEIESMTSTLAAPTTCLSIQCHPSSLFSTCTSARLQTSPRDAIADATPAGSPHRRLDSNDNGNTRVMECAASQLEPLFLLHRLCRAVVRLERVALTARARTSGCERDHSCSDLTRERFLENAGSIRRPGTTPAFS